MADTTIDLVKRHLDAEAQSEELQQLPADFYSRVSRYSQRLRRLSGSGNSEAATRLIARQTEMIESMVRQLCGLRVGKASAQNAFFKLLPEERYICSLQQGFQRRFDAFVDALSAGKPSFIEFAQRSESSRNMTVRFVRHTNELVGVDLGRYGPFEENDVASIPASNAVILIAVGDAVEIYARQ